MSDIGERMLESTLGLGSAFFVWAGDIWSGITGSGFYFLAAVIAFQFFLLGLLTCYAFLLRWRNQRRMTELARLHGVWREGMAQLLADEMEPGAFTDLVPARKLRVFGEFLRPYLLDIDGEEKDKLIGLLFALEFDQYLYGALKSKTPWRRGFATHFLGLMGHGEAIPKLRLLLEDPSEFVMYLAAESLMQLHDREAVWIIFRQLGARAQENQERMAQILFEYGPTILPELLQVLRAEKMAPWVVTILFEVFRYHHYADATPVILGHVVSTNDRGERLAGLRALAALEQPSMAEYFHDLLLDPDPVVRTVAASGLSRVGRKEHLPRLVGQLFEDDFWIVKNTIDALIELGEQGVEALCSEIFRGELPPMTNKLVGEAISEGRFSA